MIFLPGKKKDLKNLIRENLGRRIYRDEMIIPAMNRYFGGNIGPLMKTVNYVGNCGVISGSNEMQPG